MLLILGINHTQDMKVEWIQCNGDKWCNFLGLNLENDHFKGLSGVYVIWSTTDNKAVRVGSGIIKDRIAEHRKNQEITKYKNLKVTWAKVPKESMEGVEKYLADQYNPKVGERFPDRVPIKVNLPGK